MNDAVRRLNTEYGLNLTEEEMEAIAKQAEAEQRLFQKLYEVDTEGAVPAALGMQIDDVTIPHMDLIPAVKVCTSRVENASAHDHLRTRARDNSRQTLFAYLSALLVPASAYLMALRVRRMICDEFHELLKRVQVFAIPAVPLQFPPLMSATPVGSTSTVNKCVAKPSAAVPIACARYRSTSQDFPP